jgi:catechol 2,3-dioxygenase-like lactoylglutathione lyase family enzyme
MISFERVIPIFRIFSIEKAKEFYVGVLGFSILWEHRFEGVAPVYMRAALGSFQLDLSEHHGDGSPGAAIFVLVHGLDDFHREISAKGYGYLKPGIEDKPWGARVMSVTDPFGNRIHFSEEKSAGATIG